MSRQEKSTDSGDRNVPRFLFFAAEALTGESNSLEFGLGGDDMNVNAAVSRPILQQPGHDARGRYLTARLAKGLLISPKLPIPRN